MKLYFLLLHTQLYQKAFRLYLPQTTAYVTIPKFLKKKQIGAWKPVLCPWIIILYVFPLVLLEFIFLPKFLVFQIGFTDKLFTFEIRSSRFVLRFSFLSLFYSIFFFQLFFFFLKIKKKVLAVPKKLYRQTTLRILHLRSLYNTKASRKIAMSRAYRCIKT